MFVYELREGAPRASPPGKVVLPAAPEEVTPAEEPGHPIFVPTPHDVVEKMLEVARLTDKDTLVDLGSGDGRFVLAAARKRVAGAVGYEIDDELVTISRKRILDAGLDEIATIEKRDLFTADLSHVTVVVLYLPPDVLEELKPQLARLPAGSRIVSHQFEIPSVRPASTITMTSDETGATHRILLYTAPLEPRAKDPAKED